MGKPTEERATDRAERQLIEQILSGAFPSNTDLPGERTLSKSLDVARPALREAMQRLSRDGWLEIQQGRPTRIIDYLKDGNLNILTGLLKADPGLAPNLVPNLLEVWMLLAPQYTASSARRAPGLIIDLLEELARLPDEAEAYAAGMWELHRALTAYCDNVVYGLLFNTFEDFYRQLAVRYYALAEHRQRARDLWAEMIASIEAHDEKAAARLIHTLISNTAEFWRNAPAPEPQTSNQEHVDDDRPTDQP